MLSRAVLPLTRPNVLASTVRVSGLATQRPRCFTQGPVYSAQKPPKDLRSKTNKSKAAGKPDQDQHSKEQPEFDTNAKPEADVSESATVSYAPCHPNPCGDQLSNGHWILAQNGGNSKQASSRSDPGNSIHIGCRARGPHEERWSITLEPHRRP